MTKILLADDSSFMRKVLIDILSKNGYETVVEAEDGKQAVEKYDAEKPDLVLLDIIMPEMDGIAVLKDIVPKGANALIISAVGQDDIMEQATAAGAKGYIIKPFEESKVIEEIKKILGNGDTPATPTPVETPVVPVINATPTAAETPVVPVVNATPTLAETPVVPVVNVAPTPIVPTPAPVAEVPTTTPDLVLESTEVPVAAPTAESDTQPQG